MAVFSAGIGGADSIAVLPFTSALGLPDAFARRMARNTQLILLEESNLWRVADPAAGAGGFEALTDALSDRAWTLFQDIEREGGIVNSLREGAIQGRIAAVRASREKAVATRRDPITGVSEFPNIREAAVSVLMPSTPGPAAPTRSEAPQAARVPSSSPAPPAGTVQIASIASLIEAASAGATLKTLAAAAPGAAPVAIAPLPSIRSAEPFERLRDAADACLARTGELPKVFLATLGPVAAFTARAGFAKNLFEAGGIEAHLGDGYDSLDDLVADYRRSNAKLACLCSSDEIYRERGVEAAAALSAAGCPTLFLAGRPGDLEPGLREAGVETFIFAGADIVEILARTMDAVCG
jgi:methylmalonyl-CoA mutase